MDELEEELSLRASTGFHWQRSKVREVLSLLQRDPVDIQALRQHATSRGGLLYARVRKKAWPKLLGVNVHSLKDYQGPSLSTHKDRAQVMLDVNRCGKRLPKYLSADQCQHLRTQLLQVILRVLAGGRGSLHYYQGLHDIVLTVLLAMGPGEDLTFALISVLASCHIRDFMDVDMSRTKLVIAYLAPILACECPVLESFITRSVLFGLALHLLNHRSGCEYYFCLSWLITWFGHVTESQRDASRLMDFFLASHPLMPVYLSAAIVLSRRDEVLAVPCELSAVHGLLGHLPEELDYESMITDACNLFHSHPPHAVARKGGLRPQANTLVTCYPKFLRLTSSQQPDHILAAKCVGVESHWPLQPAAAWLWREAWPTLGVAKLLCPVVLAVLVYYWIA